MTIQRQNVRICFISGDISRSGGTERVGTIIANSLAVAGYDVKMLSLWDAGRPFFETNQAVKVRYLLNPKSEGKLYRTYLYPILKLHRFIVHERLDIVIDIDTELARYTSYAIRGTACKELSWEHFNYWAMQRLGEKRRIRAKKLIKKYATKLIVLTEKDRLKEADAFDLPKDFVVTMPNPCPMQQEVEYHFQTKTFLAVGRLATQKNFGALVKAWALIYKQCPDWKLVIVGDGQEREKLKLQAHNLDNVYFPGKTNDISQYYTSASCLVLSSLYEGFPMVILEAQSFGLPVIAFDCKTGPSDLISNGKNGFLVEDQNIEQLASKMLAFSKDEEQASNFSNDALKEVAAYSLPAIVDRWSNLIDEVMLPE